MLALLRFQVPPRMEHSVLMLRPLSFSIHTSTKVALWAARFLVALIWSY